MTVQRITDYTANTRGQYGVLTRVLYFYTRSVHTRLSVNFYGDWRKYVHTDLHHAQNSMEAEKDSPFRNAF
jgi:hypothetical protein